MGKFTPAEIEYLSGQRICRLAPVDAQGKPHVVPVRFRYNPELEAIDLGGSNFGKSKKFRDAARNPSVALVVDDMLSPGHPRGIEVRGQAELFSEGGQDIWKGVDPEFMRVVPTRIISWGIDGDPYSSVGRAVE